MSSPGSRAPAPHARRRHTQCGGSHASTVPQSHCAPSAFRSYQRPPTRGSTKIASKGCFADVMRGRPPGFHLFHKDGEGALDGGLDAHALTNDGFFDCVCHAFLSSRVVVLRPLEMRSRPGSTSGRSARADGPRLRDPVDTAGAFRPCVSITSPASFSTRRCCETAGRLTGSMRASSLTAIGPPDSF